MGCRGTDRAPILQKAGRRESIDAATLEAVAAFMKASHRSTPSRIAAMTSQAERSATASHSIGALLDEN
jgi:hypothetical protein